MIRISLGLKCPGETRKHKQFPELFPRAALLLEGGIGTCETSPGTGVISQKAVVSMWGGPGSKAQSVVWHRGDTQYI